MSAAAAYPPFSLPTTMPTTGTHIVPILKQDALVADAGGHKAEGHRVVISGLHAVDALAAQLARTQHHLQNGGAQHAWDNVGKQRGLGASMPWMRWQRSAAWGSPHGLQAHGCRSVHGV